MITNGKQANENLGEPTPGLLDSVTPLQKEYATWLGKMLLGAGAAGAAVRGTTGLAEIMGAQLKPKPKAPEPMMISVPYRAPQGNSKMANEAPAPSFSQWALQGPPDAKSMWDIPAALPATFLGVPLALAGGYGAVNKLVEARKQQMAEEDLEDSREEYQNALLGQFDPVAPTKVKKAPPLHKPVISKAASDKVELTENAVKVIVTKTASADPRLNSIAEKLDKLIELTTKKAEEGMFDSLASGFQKHVAEPLTSWPTKWKPDSAPGRAAITGAGLYGILAPVLAGASGIAMYNYAKNNNPKAILAEAIRDQHRKKWTERPPDIYARMVPVDETGRPTKNAPSLDPLDSKMGSADEISAKAAAFVKEMFGE